MNDVSVTTPMTQLTAPPPAAVLEALQTLLTQAQHQSLAGHWPAVIALCEAAIAQCHLHLQTGAESGLAADTTPPTPSPANDYNPVALYRAKGDVLKREGQIDAAIQAYQQGVTHDPLQAELQAQLADLYAQQRDWDAAIAHYRHAFDLDTTLQNGDIAIKLAVLYTRQQQWENAISCYGKALPLKAKPQQAELEFRIAELYAHRQQWDRALGHYQSALRLSPDLAKAKVGLGQTYLQIGHQQRQRGNPNEAVQAYLQAIAHQPELGEPYNQLRYNLMRYDIPAHSALLGDVVNICRQIAQENPQFVPAHVTLAYALTRQGEIAAATDCYRTISDRIPPRPQTSPSQTSSSQTSPSQTSPGSQAERRGPDFIIIGAEKCGTSSLYHYLRRHPAMLPPIEKEIDFFDVEYDRGLDWYLAHFPPIPQQPGWVTGETSPNYLYSDLAPERVHRHFPQTKLIVILRNPVDRTVSRFNMMVRNGTEKRSFEVAIAEELSQIQPEIDRDGETLRPSVLNWHRHIGNSLYYYHLKRWLDYFPREQLLVLRSEDLFAQPESTLQKLYGELGLKHHSESEYPQHNSGRYQPIDLSQYQTLSEFFKPHTQRLESYLDQSFDW